MAQMIVIYRTPKSPAAFDKRYPEVHVPQARQLPGLRNYQTSRGLRTFGPHLGIEFLPPGGSLVALLL
jgi:uncharacterized protein (TIGR02118 family)